MKTLRVFCAGLALAAAAPLAAQAQQAAGPLQFELRGGAGVPTGEFGEGLKTGWGINANAAYFVTPVIGIYAGYSYSRFGIKDADWEVEEADLDFGFDVTDSGIGLGAIVNVPGVPSLAPWIRGGLVYHKLGFEVSGSGGSASVKGDAALGFEVGGGLAIPVAPRISITPGVGYRQFRPRFDGETADEAVTDLTFDIGVRIRL
jgi:opacity protein-like surface antigen